MALPPTPRSNSCRAGLRAGHEQAVPGIFGPQLVAGLVRPKRAGPLVPRRPTRTPDAQRGGPCPAEGQRARWRTLAVSGAESGPTEARLVTGQAAADPLAEACGGKECLGLSRATACHRFALWPTRPSPLPYTSRERSPLPDASRIAFSSTMCNRGCRWSRASCCSGPSGRALSPAWPRGLSGPTQRDRPHHVSRIGHPLRRREHCRSRQWTEGLT